MITINICPFHNWPRFCSFNTIKMALSLYCRQYCWDFFSADQKYWWTEKQKLLSEGKIVTCPTCGWFLVLTCPESILPEQVKNFCIPESPDQVTMSASWSQQTRYMNVCIPESPDQAKIFLLFIWADLPAHKKNFQEPRTHKHDFSEI